MKMCSERDRIVAVQNDSDESREVSMNSLYSLSTDQPVSVGMRRTIVHSMGVSIKGGQLAYVLEYVGE
jgi:hypothetical protein